MESKNHKKRPGGGAGLYIRLLGKIRFSRDIWQNCDSDNNPIINGNQGSGNNQQFNNLTIMTMDYSLWTKNLSTLDY
jgi:hypothetical protein